MNDVDVLIVALKAIALESDDRLARRVAAIALDAYYGHDNWDDVLDR